MKYTSFTRINTLRLYAFAYVNVGRFGLRYLVVCKLKWGSVVYNPIKLYQLL